MRKKMITPWLCMAMLLGASLAQTACSAAQIVTVLKWIDALVPIAANLAMDASAIGSRPDIGAKAKIFSESVRTIDQEVQKAIAVYQANPGPTMLTPINALLTQLQSDVGTLTTSIGASADVSNKVQIGLAFATTAVGAAIAAYEIVVQSPTPPNVGAVAATVARRSISPAAVKAFSIGPAQYAKNYQRAHDRA